MQNRDNRLAMNEWQTTSSEIVYESPWIKVYRDEVLNQNGDPLTYSYMALQNSTVFVVACDPEGKILIQSVFRYPLRKRFWEIPAGYVNPNEEPLKAAKRELLEEAGLVSDEWISLGLIYQITGTGNVPLEAFWAKNVTKAADATDKDEDIENRVFKSLSELENMIKKEELIDSPVLAALYMAKLQGL